MRLLDLFCGKFGWARAFAASGWECIGVDLVRPPQTPEGCFFVLNDILCWSRRTIEEGQYDFIVASPPCEQFSVHGMKHFHPNPPYPELGLKLFNHTRAICEASDIPYVIENVRAAQKFVGSAVHHCGPFYLWGNAVPPLMPQGIGKGTQYWRQRADRKLNDPYYHTGSRSKARRDLTAQHATIPPELANCVCDFAEGLLMAAAGRM